MGLNMSLSVTASHVQAALDTMKQARLDGVQLRTWEDYKSYVHLLPKDLQEGGEEDQAQKLASLCDSVNSLLPPGL